MCVCVFKPSHKWERRDNSKLRTLGDVAFSAQVTIPWFMGSSPAPDSVLTARNLEPASDSVSPSLSDPTPVALLKKKKKK